MILIISDHNSAWPNDTYYFWFNVPYLFPVLFLAFVGMPVVKFMFSAGFIFLLFTRIIVHLSVILMYINSQNTAVYSGISYQ